MKRFFYILFLLTFLSTYSLNASEKNYEEDNYQWIPSANFIFNGKIAVDANEKLNSDFLIEWHMSQGPKLADAYSNYQDGPGRNVAKSLISVVYTTKEGELGISHYPLKSIFINGWRVEDSIVKKEASHRMLVDPSSKGKIDVDDFASLYEILDINTVANRKSIQDDYTKKLIANELIIGFSNVYNLVDQTRKYSNPRSRQPTYIRELKEKQTHTEKLILIKIDRDFDDIINNISYPNGCNIDFFIINIASYRHMCFDCLKMKDKDEPFGRLLINIKNKLNKYLDRDNVNIKVIFSGMAAEKDETATSFSDCRSPIEIGEYQSMLYLLQNPFRPISYKNEQGKWTTTLVLKSNYLLYEGKEW